MKSNRTLGLIGLFLLAAILLIGFFISGELGTAPVSIHEEGVGREAQSSGQIEKPVVGDATRVSAPIGGSSSSREVRVDANAEVRTTSLLHGRVLDDSDVPLPGMIIRLVQGPVGKLFTTDETGHFEFDELALGEYHIFLDPSLLPLGYLPPWKQQFPHKYAGGTPYGYGTTLRIEEHADYEIDLTINRSASVSGYLFDQNNQPIEGADVSLAKDGEVRNGARTDDKGRYQMGRVYPGGHTLFAVLNGSIIDASANSPLPVHVEIEAGKAIVVPDIIAGIGGHVVVGRIIGQDDEPVVGLTVVCDESEFLINPLQLMAQTDDDGRFRIGRLPSSDFTIDVGRPARPGAIDRIPIANLASPFWFKTLGGDESIDIGELRVHNNRPFYLTVNAYIDAEWASDLGLGFDKLNVEIRSPVDDSILRSLGSRHRGDKVEDEHGSTILRLYFEWSAPTPHEDVELVAKFGSEADRRFEVVVSPDGQFTIDLEYP